MTNPFAAEVAALLARPAPLAHRRARVLFYGSSTFTLWHDMASHFPDFAVINHGFGGSTLADCLAHFDQLVAPVRPCALVVYAGDNDLEQGVSPEQVLALVRTMVGRKRDALGDTPMAYVSIKVSPARLHFMHRIGYTNRIIEGALAGEADVRFVDTTRRMVGRGMAAWQRCYGDDPLHMNETGYRIWGRTLSEYLARAISGAAPPG
ncbi:MAG: GDSL-type esterase/lipase family protein [Rhodospirillales bacterium]|nr:GDSL-type esterase/lipase family protein [Rhodospirillales bacterium]